MAKKNKSWFNWGKPKKGESVKGLGNVDAMDTAKSTALAVGAGLGGGLLGSSIGKPAMALGFLGVIGGTIMGNMSLATASVGAMLGSMIKPTLQDSKASFADKAKQNSNNFFERLKEVTYTDKFFEKKTDTVVVKVDASKATTLPNAEVKAIEPPKEETAKTGTQGINGFTKMGEQLTGFAKMGTQLTGFEKMGTQLTGF